MNVGGLVMDNVEEQANTFALGSATIEDVIGRRVTKGQLKEYFNEIGFNFKSNRKKLDQVYDYLNQRPDELEQFKLFLAKSIMFGHSRIVTESFIANSPSPAYNMDSLLEQLDVESPEEYCMNALDNFMPNDDFNPVYKGIEFLENNVRKIDIIYTRSFTSRKLKDNQIHAEYVWFEINLEEKRFRLHFTNDRSNEVNDDLPSNAKVLFEYFRQILDKRFKVPLEVKDERRLVYGIYHVLTEQNEQKYVERLTPYSEDIDDFYSQMLDNLGISQDEDTIDASYRINRIFVRLLIARNFDAFLNTSAEGRVKAFSFKDNSSGTRLNASSGSLKDRVNSTMTYIETSDAYFDNKETIEKSGSLFSVLVQWNPGFDNVQNLMDVRYSAYDEFLETHFLYATVKKEDYDIDIQKINRIRANL